MLRHARAMPKKNKNALVTVPVPKWKVPVPNNSPPLYPNISFMEMERKYMDPPLFIP